MCKKLIDQVRFFIETSSGFIKLEVAKGIGGKIK